MLAAGARLTSSAEKPRGRSRSRRMPWPRGRHRASACAPPLRQRDHGRVGGSAHHHARTLRGIASIGLTRALDPRSPSRAVSCELRPRLGVADRNAAMGGAPGYGRCRRRPLGRGADGRGQMVLVDLSSVRSMVDRSRRVCPSPCTAHLVTRSSGDGCHPFEYASAGKITHGAATTLSQPPPRTSRNRAAA